MTKFVGPLQGASVQDVSIKITSVTATAVSFNFHTPNGNQPNTNGNVVYIWQSGDQIPWQTDASNSQSITINSPDGSALFDKLDVTNNSYIIGYAVGPSDPTVKWSKYANCVASAFIPATGAKSGYSYENCSIAVTDLGSTSLAAQFNFLDGFDPQGSGAWAGIWVGQSVSYYSPPKWVAPINGNNSQGTVAFNNIKLTRGTGYTIGLYSTGYNTDPTKLKLTPLAVALQFVNG